MVTASSGYIGITISKTFISSLWSEISAALYIGAVVSLFLKLRH